MHTSDPFRTDPCACLVIDPPPRVAMAVPSPGAAPVRPVRGRPAVTRALGASTVRTTVIGRGPSNDPRYDRFTAVASAVTGPSARRACRGLSQGAPR